MIKPDRRVLLLLGLLAAAGAVAIVLVFLRSPSHKVGGGLGAFWKVGFTITAAASPAGGRPVVRPAPSSRLGRLANAEQPFRPIRGASAFHWERCDSAGKDCARIPAATTASYTLTPADSGASLRVVVDGVESAAYGATTKSNPGASLPARMPESSGSRHVYLSSRGDDSTCVADKIARPCRTLAEAISKAANGTIIEVRGTNVGVFTTYQIVDDRVTPCRFSKANPVTIRSYPRDPEALFAGTISNVYFGGCTGIRLRNIRFSSARVRAGLKVDAVRHFELDGITSGPNGSSSRLGAQGIQVSSSSSYSPTITTDLQIWNSTIFDWHHGPRPNHNHGLYLATSDRTVVANCVIYNDVRGGGYGIQLGAATSNSLIVDNTIDGITTTGRGSAGSGIVVWGDPSEGMPSRNDLIANNLLTNNEAWGVVASGHTPGPLSVVRNNLAFRNVTGDYRPTFGENELFSVEGPEFTGDPLYAGRADKDFHLRRGSPALGEAEPGYASLLDKDGNLRPLHPALGAYG
jgi:hypothetical protein